MTDKLLINATIKEQYESHIRSIQIKAGALYDIAHYLEKKQYGRILLAVDEHTYVAAGKDLEQLLLQKHFSILTTSITANAMNDVIADEASIVELLLDVQQHNADVVIAVGGGTIHDIVRYASYTAGIGFISVPTAPSVDGFNSKGAPIILRGYKKTILTHGPEAVFADLTIISNAPQPMIAAGFGDLIGKYTSLFDWKFGALTMGEHYSDDAAAITNSALQLCVKHAALIAKRDEEGISLLIQGLIQSGVAMLLFGQSHPASGAEHHLSHYWEMEYIKEGKKQLLHGAKVGCASIEIASLYHKLSTQDWGMSIQSNPRIGQHWDTIKQHLAAIPPGEELINLLAMTGGPTSYRHLGVSDELFARSMQHAHLVRPERYTMLHAYNVER